MSSIKPITMPKWGLAMEEGVLARWSVEEGAKLSAGQEIMDIETTKIANVFESPVEGVLRRRIVAEGENVPVGALLGVVSEPGVPDAEVDAYVEEFLANFKPPEKGASDAAAPQTIDANGKRIRYLKAGPDEGTPLLLIHGFGADHTTWMFNQGDLAADRPVTAIDLPGHGGSTKDVGDGTHQSLAAAILDFMDAAGIDRAHLVGHSLGGAIATEIALTTPERVTALTLISPAGFGKEISQEFIEGFIGESRARKAEACARDARGGPENGDRRHGRRGVEIQTPRRRGCRAPRHRRREFQEQHAADFPARKARRTEDAGSDHLGRRRPDHPGGARGWIAGECESDTDYRRGAYRAYGKGGGGEWRDQGGALGRLKLIPRSPSRQ